LFHAEFRGILSDLIDTTEMYLKAILELEEEGVTPMRVRIAERLDHSGPTVSQTVARMERDGLVAVTDDRSLEFTELGRARAIEVMRKHRIAERLLLDVIGMSWEQVHEEACRWEHVMSEAAELKILQLLENRRESPFGMPIPGLELLGVPASEVVPAVAISAIAVEAKTTLLRIGEPIQTDSTLLAQLRNLGLMPGAAITVNPTGREWLVTEESQQEGLLVDIEIAAHLFASPQI
jgi:DtxR family transcriptional regulator, Mn-dependent transcriptional regulator